MTTQREQLPVYTMDQWQADRNFKAVPGQRIDPEIYNHMLNCMPPGALPREKADQVLQDYNISIYAGFLMGSPHSSDKRGQHYLAFGKNGNHYYYLGLSLPHRKG